MNNILLYSNDLEPNTIQLKEAGKEILTIHADGRITVSEDLKPTETAAKVLQIMRDEWLADIQCAKIRELQERIKRLEEALEAIQEYWNRDNNERAMEDACWHAWTKAKEAKP
jgi:phosphopantetheine adenylyltransferase